MNIYDLAGNGFEWILEHATYDTKYPCTNRGGGYINYGSKFQVSARNDDGISDKYVSLCFRVTLY